MLKKIWSLIQARPPKVVLWKLKTTLLGHKIPDVQKWLSYIKGKEALEIGGPSGIFKHYLPVYRSLKSLDSVNFSDRTLWQDFTAGDPVLSAITQKQFVAEGTSLQSIEDESYDVLLSCNNLEHIANPIKALSEWKRVLKPSGVMICVLPRKESNFDHRRPVTTLDHLISDFENNIGEDDLTHLDEILNLHDLRRDPLAGGYEQFKKRSERNFEFRALHHHVYDTELLKALMGYIGMEIIGTISSPMDYFVLAIKIG